MNTTTPLPHGRQSLLTLLMALATLTPAGAFAAGSWAFAPGAYTHDPRTGARTTQYAEVEPVEPLPDPRETVSRYWRTRTNLRGVNGSNDTIYEVRSFGNSLGGFDAQRERGFDAQQQTLRSLRPFRNNPFLFFGGMQGFGYGFPGYPGAPVQGQQVPGPPNYVAPNQGYPQPGYPQQAYPSRVAPAPCEGDGCEESAATLPSPPPGQPGTAYPYAPPTSFVAPYFPPFGYFGAPGFGFGGYPPFPPYPHPYRGHGGGYGRGHGGW